MRSEIYSPTIEEKVTLRPRDGFLKISGDGIFATRQGEGVTAGAETIFLRLHFCNLACGRDGGWLCDTDYTWDKRISQFWQESKDLTPSEAAAEIIKSWIDAFGKNPDHRIVITGGEPLLQQRKIIPLFQLLPGWAVEIETNGTITPFAELEECQFNCSPKLSNSGNTLSRRYRPEVLKNMAKLSNSWFKFVVCQESDLSEIDQIAKDCDLPNCRILVMPEGRDAKLIARQADSLSGQVLKRGWKITLRNQLIWFGDRRGT